MYVVVVGLGSALLGLLMIVLLMAAPLPTVVVPPAAALTAVVMVMRKHRASESTPEPGTSATPPPVGRAAEPAAPPSRRPVPWPTLRHARRREGGRWPRTPGLPRQRRSLRRTPHAGRIRAPTADRRARRSGTTLAAPPAVCHRLGDSITTCAKCGYPVVVEKGVRHEVLRVYHDEAHTACGLRYRDHTAARCAALKGATWLWPAL